VVPPTPQETELRNEIATMLARPEYCLSLTAAEMQYRRHYYRLNAAALLEDLFFDALGNFLRQTKPSVILNRAPAGVSGWDYEYGGMEVSHKVSLDTGFAVHWDATRTATAWSSTRPLVLACGGYRLKRFSISTGGRNFRVSTLPDAGRPVAPTPDLVTGTGLCVVDWPPGSKATVVDYRSAASSDLNAELSFQSVWSTVAERIASGAPANHIEVLKIETPGFPPTLAEADVSGVELRSGFYVLPRSELQDLAVRVNNRSGRIIPRETGMRLIASAVRQNLFVPMPTWYRAYADDRPPDLYTVQRAEYDQRFHAR
jgi:hypothetical protein